MELNILRYFMLSLVLGIAAMADAQTDRQLIRDGNRLFNAQQYDKAEMEFDNDVAHSLRCFTSFRMTQKMTRHVITLRCANGCRSKPKTIRITGKRKTSRTSKKMKKTIMRIRKKARRNLKKNG